MKKSKLEKFFSIPTEIIEKGIELEKEVKNNIEGQRPVKEIKEYWKILGPGLTTGAADDDPSGIATYSQIGASSGFGLIWLSVFTFPLMVTIQEMCARIGLTTGVGLSTNIKRRYSKKILYISTFLLLFANVFNIGADLGAMAKGAQLIFPSFGYVFLVFFFAILSLSLQIFIPYQKYSKYLKYLALVLFAYIFSAFSVSINWSDLFKNLIIPTFSFTKDQIILICAAFGTTISPYLFFWQTAQEVEEQILKGEKTEEKRRISNTDQDIHKMRIDVWSGMFLSNLIMFFIIATCGATLFSGGILNIETAADAALALKPFAGNFAFVLFAFGIIGVGLLAIPILAGSASYAISEAFNWKYGLSRKLKQASSFYGVIIVAMILGIILNFVGLHPIKVLIYSAVFNGIISPIILFFIVQISADEKIMGTFKNKGVSNILGWFAVGLLSIISLVTIVFIFL
ncbi:MAG: NRAMP family Mn2+/Fe2+ transporter [Candidatus Nomurabacteria bacterium GW2011_GWE1_32_28]|uniref:NRAMP family Mn2+/Fe2+ transporter n=1 Tax=Candidatus Nomurabacteria bacterium GW2011_GWF1_31_48 TaxID=1618767 RepID=A0A0F9YFX8_9BACT|nr:MAG: NRAMP family Mn2+/Fe2+ transporter [Candidatus Nomurabacteria bacterium GW2011_GWF2_30_133]KKP28741.1 MAG: NRAMP family Mn2+/Fe2+ transporter [Candidatus Nomurabacteria bacterium GW2011_GWE2_31_40]KKP30318.1 MAG: NRAMP family Mn2+/Fe2+ transporter [Candidatus Nomurabacteria bacterium GW2011_GWF1_31_48]KKP34845.1 MAG: NRAMP family Mn2+/Fe2+ transporter [Candidatus Nomurabacteria bacterium GW2011_GWE1_32_28]HAS80697.1 iron transporter [Candidatus Nomurabacteria bacterium]